jgi:RNA 3'-terminal phosphate cyclase (ATP)
MEMIHIDGSRKSGSGTIVRDAVPFSALVGKELHLTNIRTGRDKPGLRPQHLKAIEACARISGGRLEGASVGSREIRFYPGNALHGGLFAWDIGTAGSALMLALSLLPLALFADGPSTHRIKGGLFQDFAPSAFHTLEVLLPRIRAMGAEAELRIIRPGYVPKGGGEIQLDIQPVRKRLTAAILPEQGNVLEIRGIALASHLNERKVSERMAKECRTVLEAKGFSPHIEVRKDTQDAPAYRSPAVQPGAALALWARTDRGALLGADMAGAPHRRAEIIGRHVASELVADLASGASVDRHLADQLIPFAGLAEGESVIRIPAMTEHIESRLWLIEAILGASSQIQDHLLVIGGIGYWRGLRP